MRPEKWALVAPGAGLTVTVGLVEELGPEGFAHGTVELGGSSVRVAVRLPDRGHVGPGDVVHVAIPAGAVRVFDSVSGRRLSVDS